MLGLRKLKEQADELKGLGEAIVAYKKDFDAQNKTLRAVFDHIPAMVFYKDKQNNIIYINEYGLQIWGKKREEVMGSAWRSLTDDKDLCEKYFQNDKDVIQSGKEKRNIIEPLADDSNRMFLTRKLPLIQDGEITGVIGFSIELTDELKENVNE